MIETIKAFFRAPRLVRELSVEIVGLTEDLEQAREDIACLEASPEKVIEKIMERKISWYEWQLLDLPAKNGYFLEAQSILHNKVFNNEIDHIIADCGKVCVFEASDFAKVRDMRMTINGLQLFKERVASIYDPAKPTPVREPNAPI